MTNTPAQSMNICPSGEDLHYKLSLLYLFSHLIFIHPRVTLDLVRYL